MIRRELYNVHGDDTIGPKLGTVGFVTPEGRIASRAGYGRRAVQRVPWNTAPPTAFVGVVETTPYNVAYFAYRPDSLSMREFDASWKSNAPHAYSAWVLVPPPEVL